MGEDFLRRRSTGFVRRLDAAFHGPAGLCEPDLFSGCEPKRTTVLTGELLPGRHPPGVGAGVWSPGPDANGDVTFYDGRTPAFVLTDESAAFLKVEDLGDGETTATVLRVDPEFGTIDIVVRGAMDETEESDEREPDKE